MAKGDTTEIFGVTPKVLNATANQVLSQFWRTSGFFRFSSFLQGEAVILSALSTGGTTVRCCPESVEIISMVSFLVTLMSNCLKSSYCSYLLELFDTQTVSLVILDAKL